jgi:lipopolysaccharide biosynthesis regulator YciM
MVFRWLAILILVLALGVVYLATLNPDPVAIHLPLLGDFRPTAGLLMIFSFSLGIMAAIFFFAVRDWREYFRKLAEKKKEKLGQAARERLGRARNYLQLGLEDLALNQLRDALEKDSSLAEGHELVGDILSGRGDHYGAASSHSQAYSLDHSNDAYAWKLSRDYLAAGNASLARKIINDALELDEKSVFLLIRNRDLLMDLKDWDGAAAIQTRLSKHREYRAQEGQRQILAGIHFEKGKALLAQNQPEEAVKSLEEAIKLDPQLSLAYVRNGEAQLSLAKEKSALKIWALGYRRTSDPAILARLEEYYLRVNDPSRIINLYLRYIEEKPQDVELRLQFARLLFKLEMLQEAANQIDEIRRLQGEEHPRVAKLSYQLKLKQEDIPGAMSELAFLVEKTLPGSGEQVCTSCARTCPGTQDRCPGCGRWGTLRPAV